MKKTFRRKQMNDSFDGLGSLPRLSKAISRSISPENFNGEKGKGGMALEGTGAVPARELGQGWKISPSINIPGGAIVTLAEIDGSGAINHFWLTTAPRHWRTLILRMYWDGEEFPSVEVPLGDFFCNGWCKPVNVNSYPIAVNPAGGFNCYWQMPFRNKALITLENLSPDEIRGVYYTINFIRTDVPEDMGTFHAQWRRNNPLPYKEVHALVDGIIGQGHYVGTYIAWGSNNNLWWGEGEIKFYMDGDQDWPTICGTGTEDYFGGAWGFELDPGKYNTFSTMFLGLPQVITPDGFESSQTRFGMYRWHIPDPIRFQSDLRALGWRAPREGKARYLPLQDDIASTVFWYQIEPHAKFPQLPDLNGLEVI
jgi:hypothetical protein